MTTTLPAQYEQRPFLCPKAYWAHYVIDHMYIDQSVLDGLCGQYEAERFNITMIIFLVPYLDWVDESPGQLNLKKKKGIHTEK